MKISSQNLAFVALTIVWVMFALTAAKAEAANECEVRYFYTTSLAKNERGRWATIRGSAGQSVPVRGRLYIKEIQNTGKHDVNAFLVKQRQPMYLRPREKRNTSRMGAAAVLIRLQCLTTIAGRPQKPLASKSSPTQSTIKSASPAVRKSNTVLQKPVPAARLDRVPVQRRPPPLQSNDPNYHQYNEGFSDSPRLGSGTSTGGGQQGGTESSNVVTTSAFDYFDCGTSSHRAVNAYLLAMASHAIYPIVSNGSDNEDGNWDKFRSRFVDQFKDLGMDTVQLIHSSASGTEAAVMSNDECIIVVYRGSQSPTSPEGVLDWLVDINVHTISARRLL